MGCVGWWIFSSIINFDVNSLLNVRTWSICLTSKLDTLLDPLRIRRLPKDKLLNLALDLYSKDLEKNELSVKCAELKLENVRLRELLGLKPPSKHKVVYAEVIRRDASAWWDRLWINKGKADGLSIGDGVGYIGGIGGKISEIFETKAVVELLTSPNFRIAVQLAGDSRPFIYCGTKHVRFKRVGKLSDLPQDLFDIKETKVVSSEMSSKFPGNLFVGRLTKKIHGNGIYFDAECEIPNSLKDLREVMIFVNPK
ncbi:MAG: rod shape-determining protein MreC [Puniceicoccales bacterium]|jgi:cell shape-determining protein MreC|nr:rod shape-determining protein MreC [Puniceicoccales bacterium]